MPESSQGHEEGGPSEALPLPCEAIHVESNHQLEPALERYTLFEEGIRAWHLPVKRSGSAESKFEGMGGVCSPV